MDAIQSIILGLIQGLTEFLPVSSSGHLILGEYILGVNSKNGSLLLIIVLHFATALSTILVYRQSIGKILKGLATFRWNESFQFSFMIVISMIPAGIAGFLLEDQLDAFTSNQDYQFETLLLVGICLIITGSLLLISDNAKTESGALTYFKSFIVGISQAVAILPGISRSGSTISTSVLLKVNRENAARFSFLMVIPVIVGAMLKKILELMDQGVEQLNITSLIIGFFTAFVTGYIACRWMIRLVQNSKLKYFAAYCFLAGATTLIYTYWNGFS